MNFIFEHYYFASVVWIAVLLLALLTSVSRKLKTREVVVLASMSAIAAISRAIFFFAPQVKPIAAIIFISGSILGCVPGMCIGALGGFLSNFIFGQGPWTPFQIFALAIIGLIGGFVRTENKIVPIGISFLSVLFLYGPIVNAASMLMMGGEYSFESFLVFETSGFVFDLIFAASTAVFVFFLYKPMRNKLVRVCRNYKIFLS